MSAEGDQRPDVEVPDVIPDKELLSLKIKELNRRVKEKVVTKGTRVTRDLGVQLKIRRRTLKNRNYATSCREKKELEIRNLERKRDAELQEVKIQEAENENLRMNISDMAEKYDRILEFAAEKNVIIGAMTNYHICPGQRPSD